MGRPPFPPSPVAATVTGYRIEPAREEHLPLLPVIERAAAELFPPDLLPEPARSNVLPLATLERAQGAGRLWVAVDPESSPVGFAVAEVFDPEVFLVEVDVHPDHQRRGIGRRLVDTVVHWARISGYEAVTLTTFASLPWNAPFYERLGFRRVSGKELTPHLAVLVQAEARGGLVGRIAMRLTLR